MRGLTPFPDPISPDKIEFPKMLKTIHSTAPTCIEICSGAGGQALGLEMAGFEALAHVENDRHACATLRQNRPGWNVFEGDVRGFERRNSRGWGPHAPSRVVCGALAGNVARTFWLFLVSGVGFKHFQCMGVKLRLVSRL